MEVVFNLNGQGSGWFAPATAAQILVAGATLFLAIFTLRSVRAASRSADATVGLAQAAEREVAAAHRQNELAEKTMLANIQPVLSDYPRHYEAGDRRLRQLPEDWIPWVGRDEVHEALNSSMYIWSNSMIPQASEGITGWGVTTLFKNVGNGAAIVEQASLELAGSLAAHETRVSKLLIARDDYCRVTFNVIANNYPEPLQGGGYGVNHAEPDFFIDICYSNVSGSGRLRTRQRIQIVRQTPHISAIEIWDQETGKRLAVSQYLG